jgi:hypothetical protein
MKNSSYRFTGRKMGQKLVQLTPDLRTTQFKNHPDLRTGFFGPKYKKPPEIYPRFKNRIFRPRRGSLIGSRLYMISNYTEIY